MQDQSTSKNINSKYNKVIWSASSNDFIFNILAEKDNGWSIRKDDSEEKSTLCDFDELIFRLALTSISENKHLAITLPKVERGISLGLTIYIELSRFLTQQNISTKQKNVDFHRANLQDHQYVLVSTMDTKLRSTFLNSSIILKRNPFLFESNFPVRRISRNGNLVSFTPKSHENNQLDLLPLIFYHYNLLETLPQELKDGFLIGEIHENDSQSTTKRLFELFKNVKIPSSIIFVNSFAFNTLNQLNKMGFKLISLNTLDLELPFVKKHIISPSLISSIEHKQNNINLEIKPIENNKFTEVINKLLEQLLNLSREGAEAPEILKKAWNIFYCLRDLSIPLTNYEEKRRLNPFYKSLNFNIVALKNFPIRALSLSETSLLPLVWPSISYLLEEAYKSLKERNEKFEILLEDFIENYNTEEIYYVFKDELQKNIFINYLEKEYGWNGNKSLAKISCLEDLTEKNIICKKIVLAGAWKTYETARLLSLNPKNLKILCYKLEFGSLKALIQSINSNYEKTKQYTEANLESLGIMDIEIENTNDSILTLDNKANLLLNEKVITKENNNDINWYELEEKSPWIQKDLDEIVVQNNTEHYEPIEAIEVEVSNDRIIYLPTNTPIMVFSDKDNKQEINIKKTNDLEPGDIILLYLDQDQNFFKNAIRKTEILADIDPEVLDWWKSTLAKLNIVHIKNNFKDLIIEIQDLGCTKGEQTIINWVKGNTIAPRDIVDIGLLLRVAHEEFSEDITSNINREAEKLRTFHRKLGKRIKKRLGDTLSESGNDNIDLIDMEIDELLENVDTIKIHNILNETKEVDKNLVNYYFFK